MKRALTKKKKRREKTDSMPVSSVLRRHAASTNAFNLILCLMSVFADKNVQTHSEHLSECSKRLKL